MKLMHEEKDPAIRTSTPRSSYGKFVGGMWLLLLAGACIGGVASSIAKTMPSYGTHRAIADDTVGWIFWLCVFMTPLIFCGIMMAVSPKYRNRYGRYFVPVGIFVLFIAIMAVLITFFEPNRW